MKVKLQISYGLINMTKIQVQNVMTMKLIWSYPYIHIQERTFCDTK